jgi:hypothetical protein
MISIFQKKTKVIQAVLSVLMEITKIITLVNLIPIQPIIHKGGYRSVSINSQMKI